MAEQGRKRKPLTPHQKLAIARLIQNISLLLLEITVFTCAGVGGIGSQIAFAIGQGDFQGITAGCSALTILGLLFVFLLMRVSKSIIREIATLKESGS